MTASIERNYIVDTLLLLHDGTIVAADGASTATLDLGTGEVRGDVVIDVSAVEVASGDELYNVVLELSNSATHASGVVAAQAMAFGNVGVANTLLANASADTGTGRFVLPFSNVYAGTAYRYLRAYFQVQGTIATGIAAKMYVTKHR